MKNQPVISFVFGLMLIVVLGSCGDSQPSPTVVAGLSTVVATALPTDAPTALPTPTPTESPTATTPPTATATPIPAMTATAAAFEAAMQATSVAAQPTIAAARKQLETPQRCQDIPQDQFLLTSPVTLPVEMGVYGGRATIFVVPPNAVIRAPIGGKLRLGGGSIFGIAQNIDWLTVTQGNNRVSIGIWRGDYQKFFDKSAAYANIPVKRGEPLARVNSAASVQAPHGMTVGIDRFNVFVSAASSPTTSLTLDLSSDLWFGGAPTACQDWPPEPTLIAEVPSTPTATLTPTPSSTDFPTPPPYLGNIPTPTGRIAFLAASATNGQRIEVFVTELATESTRQVTHGEWLLSASSPLGWLPDGHSLYFMVSQPDEREHQKLMVLNLDTGSAADVQGFPTGTGGNVMMSPDGARFLWTVNDNVYLASAADATPRQLANGQRPVHYPAWSQDGKQVAFVALPPDSDSQELYLVNADGGDPQMATNLSAERSKESPFTLFYPAWSPDSEHIAFILRFGEYPNLKFEICVLSLSAHSMRCVEDIHGHGLTWLSDNRTLFFSAFRAGSEGIYKLDTTNGEVMTLTHHPSGDTLYYNQAFSPDSQFLLFVSRRDYWQGQIYALHIGSGRLVARITSGFEGTMAVAWSPK